MNELDDAIAYIFFARPVRYHAFVRERWCRQPRVTCEYDEEGRYEYVEFRTLGGFRVRVVNSLTGDDESVSARIAAWLERFGSVRAVARSTM